MITTTRVKKGHYTYTDQTGQTWDIENWYAGVWAVSKQEENHSDQTFAKKADAMEWLQKKTTNADYTNERAQAKYEVSKGV